VQAGGRADVRRAVFERVHDIAVQIAEPGSEAVLADVAIAAVAPDAEGELGRALEVGPGGSLALERGVIEDATDAGLFVGGTAAVTDLLVRGIRSRPDGEFGRGLHAQEGGSISGQRVVVDDCRELGVYGAGAGEVTLSDLVVRGTRSRDRDGLGGRGVQLQWGIQGTVERAVVDDNVEYGVLVASEGTRATFRDTRIASTGWHPTELRGRGIEALLGAELALERVRVEDNIDVGFMVSQSGAVVSDLLVAGTAPQPDSGWYGRGIIATGEGVTVEGERVHVVDNTEIGVYVGVGRVTLSDVRIERTGPQPCHLDCMGRHGGVGVFALDAGVAGLARFVIAENALAGLVLANGGRAPLTDGSIESHPVAVHAGDSAEAALAEIHDVVFVDNDRNVDATVLPLPDPSLEGVLAF
jgi:hypothetical protein